MLKPPIKNIENESIESVKVQITRAVMLSLIFASAPALLLMVARNSALALEQSLFLFILALSACLCFLASFRYISYGKAVWLPFIALTVIVSFGLFNLGITSAGINLLVLSAILAPLLLRRPHAIFLLSGSAFVYLMFGWLYVSGYLTRDFPDLSRSLNHWGLQAIVIFYVTALVIYSINLFIKFNLKTIASLERKTEELYESQLEYKEIFESVIDVLFRTDLSGRIVLMSPSCEQVIGYSPEEMLGREITFFKDQSERKRFLKELQENDYEVQGFEAEMISKSGEIVLITSNCQVWTDLDGNKMGIQGVARNISQQRLSEIALRRSQNLEIIGQLTGGVAHGFNNFLNIIGGNADYLTEGNGSKSEELEALQEIISAVDQGASLTKKMLNLTRTGMASNESVNVDSLIESLQRILRGSLGTSIELRLDLNCGDACIKADSGLFQASLINLSLNARDAMPNGGLLTISTSMDGPEELKEGAVSGQLEARTITIRVADNGSGMSEKVRRNVLEPLFTTKPTGAGHGLGLSMVDNFAKGIGGDFAIHSKEGSGTAIELKLHSALASTINNIDTSKPVVHQREDIVRILLVEDSLPLMKLFSRMLTDEKIDLDTAENGVLALEKINQNNAFDLVISDVMMPGGISGIDLLRKAREIRKDLKFVLITGYSLEEIDENLAPVLLKPFSKKTFLSTIENALSEA